MPRDLRAPSDHAFGSRRLVVDKLFIVLDHQEVALRDESVNSLLAFALFLAGVAKFEYNHQTGRALRIEVTLHGKRLIDAPHVIVFIIGDRT